VRRADRRAPRPPTGGDDLLSLLIAARDNGDALDDAEIRDQILIFVLAGHDTTAIALTFALHLLGHHPAAQARLHAEVDQVLGDRTPTARDVEDLAYTAMVLKEAMRLYPPAPGMGRRAQTADQIGGYDIPAGADVAVFPWVTHRHPEFWPEPKRSTPIDSRSSARPSAIATPTSRSAPARARASASTSRCSRRRSSWR
jgi:cytochrome P450